MHDILISKLYEYGLQPTAINMLKSYLGNRDQITVYKEMASPSAEVKFGFPQGSVLGPLLFLTYVNDLPDNVKDTSVELYADDTTMIHINFH